MRVPIQVMGIHLRTDECVILSKLSSYAITCQEKTIFSPKLTPIIDYDLHKDLSKSVAKFSFT